MDKRDLRLQKAYKKGQNDARKGREQSCPFWWGGKQILAYVHGYDSVLREQKDNEIPGAMVANHEAKGQNFCE